MAVPRELVSRMQRSEVKVSLKTSDPLTATVRSRLLSNAFDVLFKGLVAMPQFPIEMINARIRDYFQACLNKSLEHAQLLPVDPFGDIEKEVGYLRDSVAQMRMQLAMQTFSHSVVQDATSLLQQSSPEAGSPDPEALQYACNTVLRAKIENSRILAAQLSGRYEETAPRDPLFVGMSANGLPPLHGETIAVDPKLIALTAVGELYCVFKGKHDWVDKTALDVRRVLALAEEAIGANKPIRSVGTDDVKKVRDLLGALPPNYAKFKKNSAMSAQAVIDKSANGPTLSVKTQDKYFTLFKAFLRWAVNEGYLDKEPGQNIKVAGVAKLTAFDKRLPYSVAQLKAILTSPLYTGHKSETSRHRPGTLVIRDGKFWVPLIALYSGMRMGEIVQLLTADMRQEDGIWYFDVTKSEGDGKKIKTESSIRRVPVHRALIVAGLLGAKAKAKPNDRLFPDIEPGADGYFSHNLSKWWGRYSRQVGFWMKKTAFHSFRHNFKDAGLNAKIPEFALRALMGHADKSVHASYGSGPSLKVLKEEIDKVGYPIDLHTLSAGSAWEIGFTDLHRDDDGRAG
jgi:integrase